MKIPFKNFFKRNQSTNKPGANDLQVRFNEGFALHQKGLLSAAKVIYEEVLSHMPKHPDALHLLGVIGIQTSDYTVALDLIVSAIAAQPDNALFYCNHGIALQALKRFSEALTSYDHAIKCNPKYADAYNNRGIILKELRRLEEALASYEQAIQLKSNYVDAYYNRGITLHELKRFDDALTSYDQAIILRPEFAAAYSNRGNALKELKKLTGALDSYNQAIELDSSHVEARTNRGIVLQELNLPEDALASYEQAIDLKSDHAVAHLNRGYLLIKLRKFEDAVQSFSRLLEVAPNYDFAEGQLLHAKMLCCDWKNLSELTNSIRSGICSGKKLAEPFGCQAISLSESELLVCAKLFAAEKCPSANMWLCKTSTQRHAKIRVGYLCGEFREQATSILMTGLWEMHDKSRFEIFAFDNGKDDSSDRRKRIISAFDEIVDITRMTDMDAASLIAAKEIDILINLNGYFGEARQGIFSYKPSPIQVNYLGFPGTLGVDYIDYLIADKIVIPEQSRPYYSEKIAYLPNSYQANDRKRELSGKTFTRSELGLPEKGFVFCCFNNNYKITPSTFDVWMRLLKQVDGSLLWLLEDNSVAVNNLRHEAHARGVSSERLIFAPRMPLAEHVARHRVADLFLDTLPYNAHTTASDALWASLPVLTCVGNTFPGRVAASLLYAIDLPELVTQSENEYELLALELATNPEKLKRLKEKLAENRMSTPLFDTALFAQHIEAAYTQMYERYQAHFPPEHIVVTA